MTKLLEVKNLQTSFLGRENLVKAVDDVSFSIDKGESVGLVGESGSGKSVLSLSLMRLVSPPGKIIGGEILWEGNDLLKFSERAMRSFRGKKIAMIFQEPMTSLNPVFTIGNQIAESIAVHEGGSQKEIRSKVIDLLKMVGIPSPETRIDDYPHQMSGGMRQRVMIAMALALRPSLLIADEPTTALDVTIQAQILELLKRLQRELGMALLLISHDFGVVAQVAEKVMVMLNGKIVEAGSASDIFHKPQHDYTKKLLSAIPALEKGRIARVLDQKNCLEVKNLVKHFPVGGGFFSKSKQRVHAVNGVSFVIPKGQTLSLVGESGCGKTTLGLMVLRLLEADQGEIFFGHQDIRKLSSQEFRPLRAKMQMIFQDPFSSLNPRMRAGEIIEEPFLIHHRGTKEERRQRTLELLNHVGLKESDYNKYPHEFSGGQRQRIGIARAIALKPDLIVCDEPLSALDVSIQADILKLLKDLQKEFHLTYLFISHDLKVVSQISDWIAVMYLGKIVEQFPATRIFEAKHPYTQALLKAVPIPDPDIKSAKSSLLGDVPSPIQLPTGCAFHPRCPYKEDLCVHTEPMLKKEQTDDHIASCHFTHKVPSL